MITRMKYVSNFKMAKVRPRGTAYHLHDFFCQFQPGVAYKSVAYKKSMYMIVLSNGACMADHTLVFVIEVCVEITFLTRIFCSIFEDAREAFLDSEQNIGNCCSVLTIVKRKNIFLWLCNHYGSKFLSCNNHWIQSSIQQLITLYHWRYPLLTSELI